MQVKDLKYKIEHNTLSDDCLILKYKETKFLAYHYIDAICNNKKLEKKFINKISESKNNNSFFEIMDDYLYIIDIDKFEEYPDESYKNLIIVTKQVPTDLSIDYVDLCEPVNWQIEEFIHNRLSGLDENQIKWLCSIAKYNLNRLDQECKKIEIFPSSAQKNIFDLLNSDNGYIDLSPNNIFDFTNHIIKKDMKDIGELIPEIDSADLEPLGVVTILLNKFKQLASIQLGNKAPQNMSEKQFYYLKKNQCNIYSNEKLIKNIEFLSNIDYLVKSGLLELSREQLLAFIVTNVLV